jgi:hypothetical protein
MLSRLQTLRSDFTPRRGKVTFSPNVREKIASKFIYLASAFVKVMCTLAKLLAANRS